MHPLLKKTADLLALPAPRAEALWQFCLLYQHWHENSRLTGAQNLEHFMRDHLLDSLSALSSLKGQQVLDLGTGCGLPGLPLAIADPSRHWTLVDRSARRLAFVRYVASHLQMKHLSVRQQSAVTIAERYETVIIRALAPPEVSLQLGAKLLRPGGRLILMQHQGRTPPTDWGQVTICRPPAILSAPHNTEAPRRCLWLFDAPAPVPASAA